MAATAATAIQYIHGWRASIKRARASKCNGPPGDIEAMTWGKPRATVSPGCLNAGQSAEPLVFDGEGVALVELDVDVELEGESDLALEESEDDDDESLDDEVEDDFDLPPPRLSVL